MTSVKSKIQSINLSRRSASMLALTALFAATAISVPFVKADRYDDQMNALRAENNEKKANQNQLGVEAASLSDAISKLQDQITTLQNGIADNQNKVTDLQAQIKVAEAELLRQRDLLGQTIRAMYLEGDISTVEMLATSKDLSDFFDKQQYRESVNNKIKTTLDNITKLKLELNTQKEGVEKLLAEQKSLQSQLASQRAEKDRVLAMNQDQQNQLDQQIKTNNSQIQSLKEQQVAANLKTFGYSAGVAGGGGYPWGDAVCLSGGSCKGNYDWGYPPNRNFDPWGYQYRNCTSWVAFRLSQTPGASGFRGLGNAADWPGNAGNYTVGRGAQVGDAAVIGGGYGHVMYVERVNSDGTVTVSDYNRLGDGLYRGPNDPGSTRSQSGLTFVHFK